MLRPIMSDESHQYFLVVSLGYFAVHHFIGPCFVVRLVGMCQFCSCDVMTSNRNVRIRFAV